MAVPVAEHRPRAVGQRAERAEQLIGHAEQPRHAEPQCGPVTDHHGQAVPVGRRLRHGRRDALQGAAHPVGHRCRRLAVRRHPARVGFGVPLADLRVGQAFPDAAGPFPQVLVQGDIQAREAGERGRGLSRTAQVGGEDQVRAQRGQQPRGALSLRLADLVQRDIALALEPAFGIPHRLTVPPQDQPDPVAQRVLPGSGAAGSSPVRGGIPESRPPGGTEPAPISSGSGICGQSFQIRSSA